ncbi:MAG: hypothetical protein JRE58_02720 [Deltaproteobacteria bacterium]|nr:hypothetical protein [Deltaproteobacteria bacterium]MBW2591911.1 hypothetical protein [Deltaproteobacteria bacterium]
MRHIVILFTILSALFLASGCAGTGNNILDQDSSSMSDEELLKYYYQLEEEIAKCERQSDRASIGIGTGFGRRGIGFGLGVSQGIANCNADELRERRVDVRLQLKKRDVNP